MQITTANRYGTQYGNATRSIGLAFNLSAAGHVVYLEVEDDFALYGKDANQKLNFVKRKKRDDFLLKSDFLLISCTNLESFEKMFGREAYLNHPRRVYTCCFDLGQCISLTAIKENTKMITFNNKIQKMIWDQRASGIPSVTIPYGVSELSLIDSSIIDDHSRRAIWMGEFRRPDMLQRVVRFAIANPECDVSVVTRKIFDSALDPDEFGGRLNPYADFQDKADANLFDRAVQLLCGRQRPCNLRFLGPLEGENHAILGSHSIGLDFSRFPSQSHDNTKIMDYLRSGLAVICDRGTPSYRFVKEMQHGVILDPEFSIEDAQKAYRKCQRLCNLSKKRLIAEKMRKKYGWAMYAAKISYYLIKIIGNERLFYCQKSVATFLTHPAAYLREWKKSLSIRKLRMRPNKNHPLL
jgi:hypothetical protein